MTDALRTLQEEIDRTGIGANSILRNRRCELPQGLNSGLIRAWLNGKIHTIRPLHIDYLLNLYKDLPDNPWVEIDDELRHDLDQIWKRLKGELRTIYKKSPPEHGVKYPVLLEILKGNVNKTRKLNIDYLLGL